MIKTIWQKETRELSYVSTWNKAWKCSAIQLVACEEGFGAEECIHEFTPLSARQETRMIEIGHLEKGRCYALSLRPIDPDSNWCFPEKEWLGVRSFDYIYHANISWHASNKKGWILVKTVISGDTLPANSLLLQTKAGAFPFPAKESGFSGVIAVWVKIGDGEIDVICRESIKPEKLSSFADFRKRERKTR